MMCTLLNPRYEHAFDDSLGMDDDFSQPTVQRNAQQQGGQQGANKEPNKVGSKVVGLNQARH